MDRLRLSIAVGLVAEAVDVGEVSEEAEDDLTRVVDLMVGGSIAPMVIIPFATISVSTPNPTAASSSRTAASATSIERLVCFVNPNPFFAGMTVAIANRVGARNRNVHGTAFDLNP